MWGWDTMDETRLWFSPVTQFEEGDPVLSRLSFSKRPLWNIEIWVMCSIKLINHNPYIRTSSSWWTVEHFNVHQSSIQNTDLWSKPSWMPTNWTDQSVPQGSDQGALQAAGLHLYNHLPLASDGSWFDWQECQTRTHFKWLNHSHVHTCTDTHPHTKTDTGTHKQTQAHTPLQNKNDSDCIYCSLF